MQNSPISHRKPTVFGRTRAVVVVLGLAVMAVGCNSDDSEAFSVDGSWQGSVTEADVEITMILVGQGKGGVAGTAQVTAPQEGQVPGVVTGTKEGKDVAFTLEINEAIVGGSLVFEGAFQSEDVMSGTLDSGILGGSFPITFQRQGI